MEEVALALTVAVSVPALTGVTIVNANRCIPSGAAGSALVTTALSWTEAEVGDVPWLSPPSTVPVGACSD